MQTVSIGEKNLSVLSFCDRAVWQNFQQNYELRIKMLKRDDINYKTFAALPSLKHSGSNPLETRLLFQFLGVPNIPLQQR